MEKAEFDHIKKRSEITVNAVMLNKENSQELQDKVVYFLNEALDIIYIGKHSGSGVVLDGYIVEVAKERLASAYYVEIINGENLGDALAERILLFNPYENKQLPKNDKFISSTQAKNDYRVGKRSFKEFYKAKGGYEFNGTLYGLKTDFLEEFGFFEKFSKDIPRIGEKIITNTCEYWGEVTYSADDILWGAHQSYERLTDEAGEIVEVLKRKPYSQIEKEERLRGIEKDTWVVSEIQTNHFKAIQNKTGRLKTFFADEIGIKWAKGLLQEHFFSAPKNGGV
jgi:Txe/YoeB family toxin of Txe-Axe toxin-antitoxin module